MGQLVARRFHSDPRDTRGQLEKQPRNEDLAPSARA
jgi:hypothetical protein